MHILVYMYVFIYCKLESFFILLRFTYIRKLGVTGLTGSGAASGKSNHFRKAFLTSCKNWRLFNGCKFINVMFESGPCGHSYYCKSLAKITRRTDAISKKISNIMTRKLTGANPIIPFGVVSFQTVLFCRFSLFARGERSGEKDQWLQKT